MKTHDKHNSILTKDAQQLLTQNNRQAMIVWGRLMRVARKKIVNEQWIQAVGFYKDAFEISTIMLYQKITEENINRYAKTAKEYIYASRKVIDIIDLHKIVSSVKIEIDGRRPLSSSAQNDLQQLDDLVYLPLPEVKSWARDFREPLANAFH